VSGTTIEHLNGLLEGPNYLESFGIEFCSEVRMTNQVMKGFGKALSQKKAELKKLKLNFEWHEDITDEGLYYLCEGLKDLVALRDLELSLCICNEITDAGIHYIGQVLENLLDLRSIRLNFNDCAKITNEGLNPVWLPLERMSSLKKLSFSMLNCLFGQGTKILCETLGALSSLQELNLEIGYCDEIVDDDLESFGRALEKMACLQKIEIDLRHCQNITVDGVKGLISGLKMLEQLESVSLNFSWCNKAINEAENMIREELKEVTTLKNLELWCFMQ